MDDTVALSDVVLFASAAHGTVLINAPNALCNIKIHVADGCVLVWARERP